MFQVSDKERKVELDILFRDVASVLVDKTVNPETSRPYTLTMLERALKDLHFNPDPKKSAKQQALEVSSSVLRDSWSSVSVMQCVTYELVKCSPLMHFGLGLLSIALAGGRLLY